MLTWEFLLQKKGDISWLPLEAATVEILEGQYRLAARSSLKEVGVNVQLHYNPLDSGQASLQQKFSKTVSSEGLLIVLPYSQLTPGIWQISCVRTDRQSDLPPLFAAVQLDVLSISIDLDFDLLQDPENSSPSTEMAIGSEIEPEIEIEESLEIPATSELLKANPSESLASVPLSPDLASQVVPKPAAIANLDLALKISDQTVDAIFDDFSDLFNADQPQSQPAPTVALIESLPPNLLQLSQSQYLVESSSLKISGTAYLAGELEVILNDPQEMRTLVKQKFTLPALTSANQIAFEFEIALPSQISVLVGTVQLLVTPDLAIDLNAFTTYQAIAVTRSIATPDPLPATSKSYLLSPPKSSSSPIRSLELPSWRSPQAVPQVPEPTQPEVLPDVAIPPLLNIPESSDRFLQKLQQLSNQPETTTASESQLEELYQDLDALLTDPVSAPEPVPIPDLVSPGLVEVTPPITEPILAPIRELTQEPIQSAIADPVIAAPEFRTNILPRHQPIPVPAFEVSVQEIIAGVPVTVWFRLPAISSMLSVRFWVKDRQTRSIIDGPRWLLDFAPMGATDMLQAKTQLTVPLGLVEVTFEAVCVEMPTKRESYKATLTLPVTPPNLDPVAEIDLTWLPE